MKSSPAIIERNNEIILLWNTTTTSASDIGARFHITREAVCGVIHRAKKLGLITRVHKRSRAALIVKKRAETRKTRFRFDKAPAPIVLPEQSRAMGEAVATLRYEQCRYPLECDEPEDFAYCRYDRRDDRTCYCDFHHKIVYRPVVEHKEGKRQPFRLKGRSK